MIVSIAGIMDNVGLFAVEILNELDQHSISKEIGVCICKLNRMPHILLIWQGMTLLNWSVKNCQKLGMHEL